MKKLLILGSSLSSIEIVQTARDMGCYSIVTDNIDIDFSPAKKAADEYWMISTDDLDALEQKCREENVNAVFSGISEFNLDMVKALTSRLGLPCYIEDSAWKYARDKSAFKQKCREVGLPVVEEYEVSDPPLAEELVGIEYPVVVKPIDSNGNRGLSICYNEEELIKGCKIARENSQSRNILIERYVTGEETWNYYYLADGEIRYVHSGKSYRQPGYPTFLYSIGVTTIGSTQNYLDKVNDKCEAFIKAIGCRKGIVWFQFIRDNDNNYYAIEMAQRMSAGADSDGQKMQEAIGVNSLEWMLNVAFGDDQKVDELPPTMKPPYKSTPCAYFLFADKSGIVSSIQGLEDIDRDEYHISVIAHESSYVEKYRNMARIVFVARNEKEICDKIRFINNNIKILNEHGENMYIHFTDYEQILENEKGLYRDE